MRMLLPIFLLPFVFCLNPLTPKEPGDATLRASVAKWPDQKKGAVSITYDSPFGTLDSFDFPMHEAEKRNLRMSYELVTDVYDGPEMTGYIEQAQTLYQSGTISFFGHGYTHADHDAIGPDSAYKSFKLCRDRMLEWNLCATTYAYPYGAGRKPETQQALSRVGFLLGRGVAWERTKWIICPDSVREPENWLYLPSVPVAKDLPEHVHTHEEITDIFRETEKKSGWVILLYHAIGFPNGWGYYPIKSFKQDLDYLAASDLWIDHMENIANYLRERHNAVITLQRQPGDASAERFEFSCDDGLDDATYNRPLHLIFQVSGSKKFSLCQVQQVRETATARKTGTDVQEITISNGGFSIATVPDGKRYVLMLR